MSFSQQFSTTTDGLLRVDLIRLATCYDDVRKVREWSKLIIATVQERVETENQLEISLIMR